MTELKVGLRLPVFDGRAIRDAELVLYHPDVRWARVQFDDGRQLDVQYQAPTIEGAVNDLIHILKHWREYVP